MSDSITAGCQCGGRLWHSPSNLTDAITLKVGTLDDPSDVSAMGHLWISKKQSGIELDRACDQHLTQPDNLVEWRSRLGNGK